MRDTGARDAYTVHFMFHGYTDVYATGAGAVFSQTGKSQIRKNLEALKDLRDGAAHLLVRELTGIATRYFQSSILNVIPRFSSIAEKPPFRFGETGLLTLGIPYTSPSLEVLRARYGTASEEVKALIASG